ncbi:hypothetical protein PO124_20645 [Bacillus licheniformis]|nr:hypothetical protein [Bacillus licheniformis]
MSVSQNRPSSCSLFKNQPWPAKEAAEILNMTEDELGSKLDHAKTRDSHKHDGASVSKTALEKSIN